MATQKQIRANRKNAKKAGRPKGKKNKATLEKEAVLAVYRQKIMRNAGILFKSQLHLSTGVSYLYKWEKGKTRPTLVIDQEEIEEYIIKENDPERAIKKVDKNAAYYFITTERPDNRAIDSMLDRTFGKATQPVAGEDGGPIEVVITQYAKDDKDK